VSLFGGGARSSERRDREGRRLGLERRRTERRSAERRVQNMWIAVEHRSGLDRRTHGERRHGVDRRVIPDRRMH